MICPSCHHHFWENGLERCPDCQHPLPKLACDKSWKPLGSWKDFMGFDCAGFAMMAEGALGAQLKYLSYILKAVKDRREPGSLDFLSRFDAQAVKHDFDTDGLLFLAGMPHFNYNMACDLLYCYAEGDDALQAALRERYWEDERIEGFFDKAVALRNEHFSKALSALMEAARAAAKQQDKPGSLILHEACTACAKAVEQAEAARQKLAEALCETWFAEIEQGLGALKDLARASSRPWISPCMQAWLEQAALASWQRQMQTLPASGQRDACIEFMMQMNGLLHHRRFPEIYRKKLLPSWRQFVKDVRALDEAGDPSQKPG